MNEWCAFSGDQADRDPVCIGAFLQLGDGLSGLSFLEDRQWSWGVVAAAISLYAKPGSEMLNRKLMFGCMLGRAPTCLSAR